MIRGVDHAICERRSASFAMADANEPRRELSAFLFHKDTPGFQIVRKVPIMGPEEPGGHCELRFDGRPGLERPSSWPTLVQVLDKGRPAEFDRNKVKRLLRESHLRVHLNMNGGDGESVGWGADLTTDYVMFNSVYTT